MPDASVPETEIHDETKKNRPQSDSDIKPNFTKLKETDFPRTVTFGNIEVREDLNTDFLTRDEKVLYRGGFEILKEIMTAADNNIDKMVLTTPEMISAIIGLQPLTGMRTGQAALIYQAYRKAGIDFSQDYGFLEFGKEGGYTKLMVNIPAAGLVLKTYQKELGIQIPDRRLTNDEIITQIISLMGSADVRKANLAHGLLSGFPLKDCQFAVEAVREFSAIPPLQKIEDPGARFLQEVSIKGSDQVMRLDPYSLLVPDDYSAETSKDIFLPDTRSQMPQETIIGLVEGYGLRWLAPYPPRRWTVAHCQKILQADREVGLLNFVDNQRRGFKVEDAIETIRRSRAILHRSSIARMPIIGKRIKKLPGIFQVFELITKAGKSVHSRWQEAEKNSLSRDPK